MPKSNKKEKARDFTSDDMETTSSSHAEVHQNHPSIPFIVALQVYFGWGLLILLGHIRDFSGRLCKGSSTAKAHGAPGYAPIVSDFEDFYTRRAYHRTSDCWNRPIRSAPSAYIDVVDREKQTTWLGGYTALIKNLDTSTRCLNLGSYNYLGFGDKDSPTRDAVLESVDKFGCSTASNRTELGTTTLHRDVEELVARFVRKPAAMIFGMGFGTNSTGIPSLASKGSCIISDSNNHSSIVVGARSSGATIKTFKHNNVADLEKVIRKAIVEGQSRTHRPWKKIIIIVEGIYSMEGEMCPLDQIVAVKKKYGCYLYVDEAHSIGAIGATGRGIAEYKNVDTADIDIMMGTFTKSFGAVGGYLAASKELIRFLKYHSCGSVHSASISPPACRQIIEAIRIILGEDGTTLGQQKLRAIRDNANFFRTKLRETGAHVLGDVDSPIVPMLLYKPALIRAFSQEALQRKMAVVVVGFPATALLESRTRFCISAAHSKEDLADALVKIDEITELLQIKYDKHLLNCK